MVSASRLHKDWGSWTLLPALGPVRTFCGKQGQFAFWRLEDVDQFGHKYPQLFSPGVTNGGDNFVRANRILTRLRAVNACGRRQQRLVAMVKKFSRAFTCLPTTGGRRPPRKPISDCEIAKPALRFSGLPLLAHSLRGFSLHVSCGVADYRVNISARLHWLNSIFNLGGGLRAPRT